MKKTVVVHHNAVREADVNAHGFETSHFWERMNSGTSCKHPWFCSWCFGQTQRIKKLIRATWNPRFIILHNATCFIPLMWGFLDLCHGNLIKRIQYLGKTYWMFSSKVFDLKTRNEFIVIHACTWIDVYFSCDTGSQSINHLILDARPTILLTEATRFW